MDGYVTLRSAILIHRFSNQLCEQLGQRCARLVRQSVWHNGQVLSAAGVSVSMRARVAA